MAIQGINAIHAVIRTPKQKINSLASRFAVRIASEQPNDKDYVRYIALRKKYLALKKKILLKYRNAAVTMAVGTLQNSFYKD